MFTETANYITPLTRELAQEFATKLAWPGDRDHRPMHEAWLRKEYEAGRFYGPHWSKALLKGRWYRVDGKHSSMMLSKLDGEFPRHLNVNIKEFACETEGDLVSLYAAFDSRESARGGADYAKSAMAFRPEFCDGVAIRDDAPLPKAAFLLATGISIATSPNKLKMLKPRDRSLLINESPQFIVDASRYATLKYCRSGVAAALFATWKTGSPTWRKFWDEVFMDSNPDVGSPSRTLCRYLRDCAVASKNGRPSKQNVRCLFVKCIHAWNAHRAGMTTTLHYYGDKPIPAVLR